ncbi:hypothetical protein AGMMS49992_30180 [Clostridia bacterium]|nr:hypothetical protein AGMMS49992_30180 [Clostridia bacterium]
MAIGSWCGMVFQVSGDVVRTYDEYTRSTEARWGVHDVFNAKPRPQFGGQGQDEINFTMHLSKDLGVNPAVEIQKLRDKVDKGEYGPFIRNGKPEGQGDWYAESIEETDLHIGHNSEIMYADVAVVLKEYF